MKGFKETFDETKGWLFLALCGYLLYKFSGVFTALGNTATAAAEAATAGTLEKAKSTANKSKVKGEAPSATDADISAYQNSAATIAQALGTGTKMTANYFWADTDTAFQELKKYSRLLLYLNYPYHKDTKKKQTVEDSHSAQRKVNWHVLAPFYKEETAGRDLAADLKKYLNVSKYQPYIKWIL